VSEKKEEATNVGANNQPAVTEQPAATFFVQLRANLRSRARALLHNKLTQIATSFPGIDKLIKVSVDIENMD